MPPVVDLAQRRPYSRRHGPSSQGQADHKAVKSYYAALATYADQIARHEGAVRSAFQNLLSDTGRKHGWTLIRIIHTAETAENAKSC